MKCFYLHKGDYKLFEYRPTLFSRRNEKKILNGFHLTNERTRGTGRSISFSVTAKEFENNAVIMTQEIEDRLFLTP